MPRIARVVVPRHPHHIVQRGNRRQKVFFSDLDKEEYLKILKEHCQKFGVQIWSYCLMDNHVHFIAVPEEEGRLSLAFGHAHWRYTKMINRREKWRGYLWQGRFSSYVLDENYLYAAVRYVENNPVEAGLVARAEDYRWSSARARILNIKDELLSDFFLTTEIANWSEFLQSAYEEDPDKKLINVHLNTGRPLAAPEYIDWLQFRTGVKLSKSKPGPKPRVGTVN